MSLIHYIIVRRDLPLGVMAAMVTHAAGESAALYKRKGMFFSSGFEGATAVVLEAKSEDALVDIGCDLLDYQVDFVSVRESSEPYSGQLMAIGLVPVERDKVSSIMEPYQTLKKLDPPPSTDECTCTNCSNRRLDKPEKEV